MPTDREWDDYYYGSDSENKRLKNEEFNKIMKSLIESIVNIEQPNCFNCKNYEAKKEGNVNE